MEKIKHKKYKKEQEYSHFCFCVGLRPGVIISSILWMVEGVAFSTIFIRSLLKKYRQNPDDEREELLTSIYYYVKLLSIVLSFYFVILSFISAFGLVSLINKSMPFLRMYSYASWFFTVFIYSVLAIVTHVGMIANRDRFIDYCKVVGKHNDPNDNYCVNKVNSQLLWLVIITFFQGCLHIYFSIILRAYINRSMYIMKKQRKQKSTIISPKQPIMVPSENSSSSSLSNIVFNIKVDRTFDARINNVK
uniref:Lysosomal-associated transmembrane protein 5 n=1 Tax=Anthurium amnicola TaxID=1678845 RepID=A0A1D1Y5F1_9ARAE